MPRFSKAVSVIDFIQQLYSRDIAQSFLDSRPDNTADGHTFRDAFKDTVINFTHWVKWADDSAPDVRIASYCFIRCMALACTGKNSADIEAFIPVLLNKSAPVTADNMTGILIQLRLRTDFGRNSKPMIFHADTRLFPPNDSTRRPYIVFVLELGIIPPPSILPMKLTREQQIERGYRNVAQEEGPETVAKPNEAQDSSLSVHSDATSPGKLRSERCGHPRFTIFVYGCSPAVYEVIQERDRSDYECLLQSGAMGDKHAHDDFCRTPGGMEQEVVFLHRGRRPSCHYLREAEIDR